MRQPPTVSVEHTVKVGAPAADVYRLLGDVERWPEMFGSFVHLEVLGTVRDPDGEWERVAVWTHDGDQVHRWVKRRVAHPESSRIDYYPEELMPLLSSMRRSFVVEPIAEQESVVRLLHRYSPVDDDPDGVDAIGRTIDDIANAELAAVRDWAEPLAGRPELRLVLTDAIEIDGNPADVYDFLWEAERWPKVMPHVSRVTVPVSHTDRQIVEVSTVEPKGGTLGTRLARVGQPHRTISFKHLALPPIGRSHLARWSISEQAPGRTSVASEQRVVLDEAGIAQMLGPTADVGTAATFARQQIGNKNRLILEAAKAQIERGRRG